MRYRLAAIAALLVLASGCAQWERLTPTQQKVALVAGAVVLGAAIEHNRHEDTTTIVQLPPKPEPYWPPRYCKLGERC